MTAETCDLAAVGHTPQERKGIEVRVTAGGPSGLSQVRVLAKLRADCARLTGGTGGQHCRQTDL